MYAASRIEQYLRDHPDGDLLIAVGYATAAGMAWLAQRTAGRRVSVLIGNTRSQYWKNVSEPDRAACLEFMHRPRCGDPQLVPDQEIPQRGVGRSPQGLGHARQLVTDVRSGRIREPHTPRARQQRRGHGRSARQRDAADMGHRARPLGEGLVVRRPADRIPKPARTSRSATP